jgi:hypothetical protein
MRIRRRSLRKFLIAVGCVVGTVDFPAALVGVLLLVSGSALHCWSKGCLEQNLRLTTAGPYRWTRNPFYLANLLVDVGLCFVIGRVWVAAVFLPIWWYSYRETIAREEARLLELFPEEFPDYRNSVPRLIPTGKMLPLARAAGRFSWQNDALLRGSEYARLLGIGLAPGMIWAGELLRRERAMIFEESNSLALGLLSILLCGWAIKLGLAETFRRPETALLPFGTRPLLRGGIAAGLVVSAVVFESLWGMSLVGLWCSLWVLDRIGDSRLDPNVRSKLHDWRYFPAIATVSLAMYVGVALMVRSVGG